MIGISREQCVQERRSAAWQTQDEERLLNFLTRNLWIRSPVLLYQQAIA
jgi:hypothetical protein